MVDEWLTRRYHLDLDERAESALRAAGRAFEQSSVAEARLSEAAAIAPDHPAVLLGHYRYYLYKHRYDQAERFARRCLAQVSNALGLPANPLDARSEHGDFRAVEPSLRFWMFGVQALGYVLLRRGRAQEGEALLRRLVELDADDQTKTRSLLAVIERAARRGADD